MINVKKNHTTKIADSLITIQFTINKYDRHEPLTTIALQASDLEQAH